MEIRRFGVGNRRPEGPPGSTGVQGQVIHSDARGVIAELAFAKGGRIEPHQNPNTTWFLAPTFARSPSSPTRAARSS